MGFKHLLWKYVTQDPQYEEKQVPCDELTFSIEQALYSKLLEEATEAGATFSGDQASLEGLEFDWSYDAVSQTLHVTCVKHPFYASCEKIAAKIQELISNARTSIG